MPHPYSVIRLNAMSQIPLEIRRVRVLPVDISYAGNDDTGEEMIMIGTCNGPHLLMDSKGVGRLVREFKSRGQYNNRYVYINQRKYHVATPFEQPLSILVGAYERALKTLPVQS